MALNFETPDWLNRWGSLLIGCGVIASTVFGANQLFGQFGWLTNSIALVILALVWTIIWMLLDVPPPRNSSDRFGIGIFIITESEKARLRVENDLLQRMRETIDAQGLGHFFELVLAKESQAKKFSPLLRNHRNQLALPDESRNPRELKRFTRFQKRTNSHFFIWGTLIERHDADLGGKSALILKSNALVIHSQIAPFRKKILEDQFKWLTEIKIDEDAEYQGLQFTADELILMADLVVGTVAAMVGNVLPALSLHEKLLQHIEKLPHTPSRSAIKKHVTAMIVDELSALAALAYLGSNDGDLAKDYLGRASTLKPNHHGCLVLLARIQFEYDNDPVGALATTHRLKPVAEGIGIWRYNIAFLEMFNGHHKSSWKMYQEIIRTTYQGEDDTVSQVIEFNEKQAETGFLPSIFIIGLLYVKKAGNLPEGLRYLETFVTEAKADNNLSFLVKLAADLRREVLKEMNLER